MPQGEDIAIPRTVPLFSGHMIDAPERPTPRFPPDKEPIARAAIDDAVGRSGVRAGDLAICGGACGGDLLFAETCLARGLRLKLYIPFEPSAFLAKSVDFAGADWHDRFLDATSRATLHVMPDELEPTSAEQNPYERNNLWMLERAGQFGAQKLVFICLWNGDTGDGLGGTAALLQRVQQRIDRIDWLNTTTLWR
jgi:hypothetical protein